MNQVLRQPPANMSVSEFIDWEPGDPSGSKWQLIDGEPVAMAPISETHGILQGELSALIRNHLRATGSSCRMIIAPGIIPQVSASENFRIPDIGVTCAPPGRAIEVPDPVLLIETLSPNNQPQTRANIWSYTTIPSVQEILVIHSTRINAEILRRNSGGWPSGPVIIGPNMIVELESIGFSVLLADLYAMTALKA